MSNLIHSTAIIADGAQIAADVKIGPFCVIGANVKIGAGTELKSHVVIEGYTELGENNIIYPFAVIGTPPQDLKYHGEASRVIIGNNNVIREYTTIQPGTEAANMETVVGSNSLFMLGTHIAHDCVVGDNVIFANNATIAGHVIVEDNVRIGGLAAVHQFVRIGRNAIIGGVTAVVRDVIPYGMVTGDRASLDGINLVGLRRQGIDREEITALQDAVEIVFAKEQTMNENIEIVKTKYPNSKMVQQLLAFLEVQTSRSYTLPRNET